MTYPIHSLRAPLARSPLAALTDAIGAAASPLGEGSTARVAPMAPVRLGTLSERYESGGRGPGTVSTGLRDPGGVSYGLYQLASKTGTAAAFVCAEGLRWSRDFVGKTPGSASFSAAWQAVAAREPDAFAAAQHAFIERTHYRPVVMAVKTQTGLDLDQRAPAVRDAVWSCAVQHGGAARIVTRGVSEADKACGRSAPGYDRALIGAIYDARTDYVRRIAVTAESGVRRTMNDLAARRYPDERARALAMLG